MGDLVTKELPPPERGRVGVGVVRVPHPVCFANRPPLFKGRLKRSHADAPPRNRPDRARVRSLTRDDRNYTTSMRWHARFLDHLAPDLGFLSDEGGGLGWRAADGLQI